MKQMRRVLAVLLAVLLICASLPAALAEDDILSEAFEPAPEEEAELSLGEASGEDYADFVLEGDAPQVSPVDDEEDEEDYYDDEDEEDYDYEEDEDYYDEDDEDEDGYYDEDEDEDDEDDGDFSITDGVLTSYHGDDASVTIPDGVTSIAADAFEYCDSVKRVVIPASVTHVGSDAFWDCEGLESVVILSKQISFDNWPFYSDDDDSLPAVVIYTAVGSNAAKWAIDNKCNIRKVGDTLQIALPEGVAASTYNSGNPAVATVSASGLVTMKGVGTVRIDIALAGGGSIALTLQVAESASLSATSASVKIGKSVTLKVNKLFGRKVTWSTSDKKIATVKDGKVTGKKAGTATISAKIENGATLKCKVKVTDPAKLSKTSAKLKIGKTLKLKVSGLAGRKVTWSTSNKKIATVKGGKITAKKAGTATITAKVKNGKTLKCKVKVSDPAKLSKASASVAIGETTTVKLSGLSGRSVTWSTSDASVASIEKSDSGSATVKAGKKGTATIKAAIKDGKTLKCKVTVKDPLTIKITGIDDTSIYNELNVIFYNNSSKDIIYVRMDINQYDNRKVKLSSPYSYFYLNETIKAHDKINGWEYWVNDDTKSVDIIIRDVTFADGSHWKP